MNTLIDDVSTAGSDERMVKADPPSRKRKALTRQAVRLVLVAIQPLIFASCATPEVRHSERPLVTGPVIAALLDPDKLTPATREYLKEQDLYAVYRRDPAEGIRILRAQGTGDSSHAGRLALVELCADSGDRFTAREPRKALGYHLAAAELASAGVIDAAGRSSSSSSHRELVAAYNHSAGQVARLLFEAESSRDGEVICQGPDKVYRLRCRTRGTGLVDPGFLDTLVPAAYLEFRKIKLERVTREGVGAAMVGYREGTPERRKANPLLPPEGMALPVNAMLDYSRDGGEVELVLRDLMLVDQVRLAGRSQPLAADFTAAIAILYNHELEHNVGWKGLTHPDKYMDRMGLYQLEPYRPDQIPVVFVHGLVSSPETWLVALNQLRSDPVLRNRYQLLVFAYPTGFPVVYNAAALRKRLREFQERHDPGRRNPRMREMVIIGHSMGGILSNTQIRSSGDSFTRRMFTRPIGELDGLSDVQKTALEELLVYKANPDITRAIFVAAPHRGSEMATGGLGRLGMKLIKFPFELLTVQPLPPVDGMTELGRSVVTHRPDSIQSLKPNGPGLTAILEQPVRRGVAYHSIIAQEDLKVPVVESSDGVVPYWSSHLDGARSEKVVHGKHSITGSADAVAEVRRILYLHAGLRPPREAPQ